MTEEREPTERPICDPGDVVQITDENHPWYPAILVIGEVRVWGVQACVLVPESNVTASCSQAWNRLRWGTFGLVGKALVRPG